VGGLLRVDLDAENGDATRGADHSANAFVVVDDVATPIVVVL
jgi:hypothetical protein